MENKKNFRDYLYDINDILIAILIILLAMGVIAWRVMKVMDYPNTLDSVETAEEVQTAAEQDGGKSSDDVPKAEWKNGKLAEDITVTLSNDSTDAAIASLVASDLFASSDQFKAVCRRSGVSAAGIKAGKFTFKEGSTKARIAKQVTK